MTDIFKGGTGSAAHQRSLLSPDGFNDLIEKWSTIEDYRQQFLRGEPSPGANLPILNEIIASWERARRSGVDPSINVNSRKLSDHEVQLLQHDNQLLIESFHDVLGALPASGRSGFFSFAIIDSNGVTLVKTTERGVKPGTIMSEDSIGISVHSYAQQVGRYVRFIGPLNYCNALANYEISEACPLLDQNGETLAVIVFIHPLGTKLYHAPEFNADLLPFIGNNIGRAYQTRTAHNWYRIRSEALASAANENRDGLAIIDNTGQIIYANRLFSETFTDHSRNQTPEHIRQVPLLKDKVGAVLSAGVPHSGCNLRLATAGTPALSGNLRPLWGTDKTVPLGNLLTFRVDKNEDAALSLSAQYTFDDIQGSSPSLQAAMNTARVASKYDAGVLILGESGTGKEMFAQAIHNYTSASQPFVAVNCAAIPTNLIESELFGYESGAFTGAEKGGKKGKIELANNGTLFLDEIGDMPLEIQAVLLRVLEEHRVMRIGSNRYIPVAFRVIAATNKDLYKRVESGQFRMDLYFRLAELKMNVPALRERGDDILQLADLFIGQLCARYHHQQPRLADDARRALLTYSWPGNVRQLKNVIFQALINSGDGCIRRQDLFFERDSAAETSTDDDRLMTLSEYEKFAISEALTRTGHDTLACSKMLGISRATLYRKMSEYGISKVYTE